MSAESAVLERDASVQSEVRSWLCSLLSVVLVFQFVALVTILQAASINA